MPQQPYAWRATLQSYDLYTPSTDSNTDSNTITYGFREVTPCAVASSTETTTTPGELPPSSHSTTDSQLHSSSLAALELQPTLAHSEAVAQPELEPTFDLSTPPSSLSHPTPLPCHIRSHPRPLTMTPSSRFAFGVFEDHLEYRDEPVRTPLIIPTSLSLPSTLSLASPCAGDVPEIACVSPAELPANLVRPPSAFGLPPILPASSD
ncbi:hypothetical protein EDB84DRAFT_1560382 [Lactarius hengduanensis]|nr:hypothetical protein EDB84DRAFT_1560382 [Lactarius hengduanensis]